MNRIMAGIVVDSELYEELAMRRYNIGPGWGEVPLKTAEMYAVSKDLEKYPDVQEKCRGVIAQVKEEIKKYYSAKDGREGYGVMKYLDFIGYVKDVQKIQADMGSKAESARNAVEESRAKWKEVSNDKNASEVTRASWRAANLQAEENFKKAISELHAKMKEELDKVQEQLLEHLNDFYSPNGSRIDDSIMKLLNADFPFNEVEFDRLTSGYTNNPTMLRVLSHYAETHSLRSEVSNVFFYYAELRGKEEMKLFKSLRGFAEMAIRDKGVVPSYQPAFENAVEKTIASLQELPVRPDAE